MLALSAWSSSSIPRFLLLVDPGVPLALLVQLVALVDDDAGGQADERRTPAARNRAATGRRFDHLSPRSHTVVGLALIGSPSR